MKKELNLISLWRVAFTYVIAMFHLFNQYGKWTDWAIGVEFFFIVSGWLLADTQNRYNFEAYEYVWRRIKRLYPEYFAAFIIACACKTQLDDMNVIEIIKWLRNVGFRELIMIHSLSFGDNVLYANIPTWYIPIMLFSGLIIYSITKKSKKIVMEVVVPISIVLFITYAYRNEHTFMNDAIIGNWISLYMLRGFSEMGVGYCLYYFNKAHQKLMTNKCALFGGNLMILGVIVVSFFVGSDGDIMYLVMLSVGILIAFNTKLVVFPRVILFLEKISYSVFLIHHVVRRYLMPQLFGKLSFIMITSYLIIITVCAIFLHYFVFWVKKVISR